jgi:hypothetical protein
MPQPVCRDDPLLVNVAQVLISKNLRHVDLKLT